MITPRLRKLTLTTHVVASVSWLGAVVCSLALGLIGLFSHDVNLVRGAYLTLEVVGWWVLVPMSVASLLTGIIQSLGTAWGLFRHYWVLIKLLLNVVAIGVLLMYMQTLGTLADLTVTTRAANDLDELRSGSPVVHAGAAVLLLLIATVLSIYKPKGMTRYGWRKQQTGLQPARP